MDRTFVERLAELVQVHANAKQVYGDPIERNGATIIPVARVQWGFGGGGSQQRSAACSCDSSWLAGVASTL